MDYFLYNRLFINVWLADSLIHLGTAAIPLKVRSKFLTNKFLVSLSTKFIGRGDGNSMSDYTKRISK